MILRPLVASSSNNPVRGSSINDVTQFWIISCRNYISPFPVIKCHLNVKRNQSNLLREWQHGNILFQNKIGSLNWNSIWGKTFIWTLFQKYLILFKSIKKSPFMSSSSSLLHKNTYYDTKAFFVELLSCSNPHGLERRIRDSLCGSSWTWNRTSGRSLAGSVYRELFTVNIIHAKTENYKNYWYRKLKFSSENLLKFFVNWN